ncbi:MAG TPA: M20/M25/M40 family metallo-hydrolase [Clostridia bacterium]|nr:M20/M25/M40 family metallo-hydrolase [Clostridia bacterium]
MLTAGEIVLICVFGALAALIIFMIIRTALTKKEVIEAEAFTPPQLDTEAITKHLSEAVKIPTITVISPSQSFEPFVEYKKFLEETYPNIFKNAEVTVINGYSLVIKLEGEDKTLLPFAFLAHQDVVPAPKEGWEHEPFGGEIEGGFVHGRGSQDMKGQMIANLEAMESILSQGKKLRRTVYFCFGHDEEYTGKDGARNIVNYLYENNIRFECVFDEGGTVLDGKMFGLNGKLALIGTCEKGYVDYTLASSIPGGHASAPAKKSAVDTLAEAIYLLRSVPMKAYWSQPAKDMFKSIAPHMKPLFKFVFVNRDILSPLLKLLLVIIHPIGNSFLRTTFAFTQIEGSNAPNVIPPSAKAVVNCRINIGQTQADVEKHMRKVVGKNIEIGKLTDGYDPSPVSDITSEPYKLIKKTITEVFPDFIPAPYPFIAATDAKHYYKVCDNVFRFTPFEVTAEDQSRIHALNERCSIKSLITATQFFVRLIENTCL